MLSIQNISLKRGYRTLFSDLDISIRGGEVIMLKGNNGSGKTSLLKIIAGIIYPELMKNNETSNIYIGHKNALKSHLTVRENLEWQSQILQCSRNKIDEVLEKLELQKLSDIKVGFLSAGQQRQVCFSQLLMKDVSLWLLDEPTNNLDQLAVSRFVALVNHHCAKGGSAIIASHDSCNFDAITQTIQLP
jgi:heme exporter protein A